MADSGLDRLIEALYGCVVEYPDPAVFRAAALERLCAWCGAGAAAWLTQTAQGQQADFTHWRSSLEAAQVAAIACSSDRRWRELSPAADWLVDGRPAATALALRLVHRAMPLHSTVLLLFAGAPGVAGAALQRALGHLVQAGSLSLLQLIQRDQWLQSLGRPSRGCAALVDAQGRIVLASRRFFELLPDLGHTGDDPRLPFPLPAAVLAPGHGELDLDRLHVRMRRSGGLLLMHARRPHPLDALTPREQEIARALAAGKTFKTIARDFDIAISTVANHASRIYRKLGLFRREELVGLLRQTAAA
ncbi:helix-turn-helix transcriptional regulator [Sinimarinibacterium thermocellulolyticum]|uniref:Helix-turn-helix transcriptional regulator n=1 Tax=Sinimarinibacterium thermocellulolyticum TaxID=3170016 RepID=A0ABV2AAW5_9GAMM